MAELKQILYLHHTGKFSGAENSLIHLVKNLDGKKFNPFFLCPGKGEFPKRLSERRVPIIQHNFGRNSEIHKVFRSILKICRTVHQHKIALLHSNGPQTNIPAGIAGRLMGIPVIWHERNLLKNGMIDLDRLTDFLPNRIICNSEAIRARFKNSKSEKISKTIMNGVDLKNFDPSMPSCEVRKEFKIPSKAKVVGMTSRLGKDKGQDRLLEAVAHLTNRYPNLWILIVGGNVFEDDDDVPDYFKGKASDLGISERTIFTGFRNDVYRLYAAMDIFVMGTDAEPCGRVIFEAMAMKKPVVGTNSGGTPEIVINGETGLLFDYGNTEELASKIDYLLHNPKVSKRMGNAGRTRIEDNFTIDKNVNGIQKEYFTLLEVEK